MGKLTAVLTILVTTLLAAYTAAEPLRIQCTAPLQNNSGTCVSPTLSATSALDSLWVVFRINGAGISRRDSVWRRPGGAISLSYNLPRGTYTIEAFGLRKGTGGTLHYGCSAQITAVAQTGTPARPTFGP